MRTHIVAKANATAMYFVAKAEKERDGWHVAYRLDSYTLACRMRDGLNGTAKRYGNAVDYA